MEGDILSAKEGRLHVGHNLSVKVEGDRLLIYFERAEEILGGQSVNVEIVETLEARQVRRLIKHYIEHTITPPDEVWKE